MSLMRQPEVVTLIVPHTRIWVTAKSRVRHNSYVEPGNGRSSGTAAMFDGAILVFKKIDNIIDNSIDNYNDMGVTLDCGDRWMVTSRPAPQWGAGRSLRGRRVQCLTIDGHYLRIYLS